MILSGFNRKKKEELGYDLTSSEQGKRVRPEVMTSLGEVNTAKMRPVVRSGGEPSELPPYVIFVRGTPAAWAQLQEKNKDTLYFISEKEGDKGTLYLGDKLIGTEIDMSQYVKYSDLMPISNADIDIICV